MAKQFLYEKLEVLRETDALSVMPEVISKNVSPRFQLRPYQEQAFENFVTYYDKLKKDQQGHTLFHMATGSGKTVIMAGLILYLYTKGYRKFLFFVNSDPILNKTIDNFMNPSSSKYLFNQVIGYMGKHIQLKQVTNFSSGLMQDDIEIVFTTTQQLYLDLSVAKENGLTEEEFKEHNVVFISDESHHLNSWTKKPTKEEEQAITTWETAVMTAFRQNKENIMLEFTATCDLKDDNVLNKYRNKIVFNYPLKEFRRSGYTKEFHNFTSETKDLWTRTLMALVMSEYRKYLFAELKVNVKPVVLLKSKTIKESAEFYDEFFKKIRNLTSDELRGLKVEKVKQAIDYFATKDDTLALLVHSLQDSFTKDTSLFMNTEAAKVARTQLLVNSLEDEDNPIRLIFVVDKLDEGWDVLNLFDIVRLYNKRANKGYTIREAQLIGRGARYCPFVIDDSDTLKFVRKYDDDLTNPNRLLETMYFHSIDDSKYISELKSALIESGIQDPKPHELTYTLKDSFKQTDFYKKGIVYANKRIPKERLDVATSDPKMSEHCYYYTANSSEGTTGNLFDEGSSFITAKEKGSTVVRLKNIEPHILLGASDYFDALRFNVLKDKYPSLQSRLEFFTSEKYLGNSTLEIRYNMSDTLTGSDWFDAVKSVCEKVSSHVSSLKPEYFGSAVFEGRMLRDVLKDKTIYLDKIDDGSGKGHSQIRCEQVEYRVNLEKEDWYVFNDNYGTSEEKWFIKRFKDCIAPLLKERNLEYYVIRNERIPELAIYSFDSGERFEPDFLLFVRKKDVSHSTVYQAYVEPKGSHLMATDAWKEQFLLEIADKSNTTNLSSTPYKVMGLPFFNHSESLEKWEQAIIDWLDQWA